MGDHAPRKSEVRSEAEGLDRQTLNTICALVEASARASTGKPGANPWKQARDLLARERRRMG
jgi:hypothetical protein